MYRNRAKRVVDPTTRGAMEAYLEIDGLSVGFKKTGRVPYKSVLDEVTISIERGEFSALLGPSGCGKSTLLKAIAGLLPTSADYQAGRILVEGNQSTHLRKSHKISFVFQKAVFFNWLTIDQNILLPTLIAGLPPSRDRLARLCDRFKVAGFLNAHPYEVSGGMLARASLVRALITDPQLLLLDEAFNGLDEALRQRLIAETIEFSKSEKVTVVMVTHNVTEATMWADRVFVLGPSPARILKDIPLIDGSRKNQEKNETDRQQVARKIMDLLQEFL